MRNLYIDDIRVCLSAVGSLKALRNADFLITGATGLIGRFLVDVLMLLNSEYGYNCRIYAMGRSREKAFTLFHSYTRDPRFQFIEHDINLPLPDNVPSADYIVHLASTTHPRSYALEPMATITTNVFGTYNLLQYMRSACEEARFVCSSSVEIYGQNRGDCEAFDEEYCGYINCNTLRAGYPESKRLSEAMCQAAMEQHKQDCIVVRLSRTYGPTMLRTDSKALSQFLLMGAAGEDIILKSEGKQYFSYTYVADAVSAILSVMLRGKTGEAYNVADPSSDIKLWNLACIVAEEAGVNVRFDMADNVERKGFSPAVTAILDPSKIHSLGWSAQFDLRTGINHTLRLMRENYR